jgi:hypothetical protein
MGTDPISEMGTDPISDPQLIQHGGVRFVLLQIVRNAIYLGNGLRRLMFWCSKEKTEEGRVSKWLVAKGPWAIGLLGPGLLGPTIAAGLAGAIGLPRARSLALLCAGIVVWTAGLVAAGAFGVAALR